MKIKYAYLVFDLNFPFPQINGSFSFDSATELKICSIKSQIDNQNFKHWPEWIGSLQWDSINNKKLILSTWIKTDKPDVLDEENEELRNKIINIFRMLPLLSPLTPPFGDTFILSGKGHLVGTDIKADDVRSFSKVQAWTRSYYNEHHWTEFTQWTQNEPSYKTLLDTWRDVYLNFHRVLVVGKVHRQILECFRSFEEGMKSTQLEFKMPNLVRAVESIVDCWGAKQFSSMVLFLAGNIPTSLPFSVGVGSGGLLEDLYQLRNDCSHGKPFAYSLQKSLGQMPSGALIAKYEFLAEWIARKILTDAFINPTILQAAVDRDTLVDAWKNKLIKPI